ncbi:hypothetical protein [Microvirga roseola]|uniref:hypothetical protein n=1 Tax=Microvirga roseola TaxID=2883126 RepID=UPI001E39BC91|nr:hypothetical protein [Microvirga roseola]
MRPLLKAAAALVNGASLTAPAVSEPGPHAVINAAEALLRAYKAEDPDAFRQLLAPSLQDRYSGDDLRGILARCRALTYEIDRFSIPSWGTRYFGFFGVYAEMAVLEMILEIDDSERIVHWVITNDVNAGDQPCRVGETE